MFTRLRARGGQTLLLCILIGASGTLLLGQAPERKLVKRVEPTYPPTLKSMHIGGAVKLKLMVTPEGTVKDVQIIGGNSALVDASIQAVRQWKYAAAERESGIEVTLHFNP